MKIRTSISMVLAASFLTLAAGESVALACATPPPAPAACVGRNLNGYNVGIFMGSKLVDQIWGSTAVGQDIDNWDILVQQVTVTIPAAVTAAYSSGWSQYTQCRVQGLLDSTVCRMNELDPIPGCQLDGVDWGSISAQVYCGLSIALDGLADVPPWFTRLPRGLCGDSFETFCGDTYRYAATRGGDALDAAVQEFMIDNGLIPASFLQPVECVPYTEASFAPVFDHSVYIDCSYEIP